MKIQFWLVTVCICFLVTAWGNPLVAQDFKENIYDPGQRKSVDSELKVEKGDPAPDFALPSISGDKVQLSDYQGQKNVMISFVPAAWTPVCSDQWPGYDLLQEEFQAMDTIVLGITADNIPTLHAWIQAMGGLWFPVLSDFWPHGEVAEKYGVLRSDGTTERALIFIDKQGVIRSLHVSDINKRPSLESVMEGLQALQAE
ncbi:MAG: peroxiredoxin [Desulfohalobiaceae bacterium]